MKKVLLIAILLFISLLSAEYRLKEVVFSDKSGEVWNVAGKEEYLYSVNGLLQNKNTSFKEGTNFVLDRTVKYKYDSGNQLASDTTYYLGGGWIDKEATGYIYENGKLKQQNGYFLEAGSTAWTYDLKTFFYYNSAGAVAKEERDYHFSWGWQDEIRADYYYLADSVTIDYKTVYDYMINRVISKFVYTYANGRISSIIRQKVNADNSTVEEVRWENQYEEITGINDAVKPENSTLSQNYPNPFNPETTISYQLSAISDVKLAVYNAKGELVKTLVQNVQNAGRYSVTFEGTDLNSGVYFYKLTTPESSFMKKMVLVK